MECAALGGSTMEASASCIVGEVLELPRIGPLSEELSPKDTSLVFFAVLAHGSVISTFFQRSQLLVIGSGCSGLE